MDYAHYQLRRGADSVCGCGCHRQVIDYATPVLEWPASLRRAWPNAIAALTLIERDANIGEGVAANCVSVLLTP